MSGDRWTIGKMPSSMEAYNLAYYKWQFKTRTQRFAHVFICDVADEAELRENWQSVMESVAFHVQGKNNDLLERSNFYIWYFVKGTVSFELQSEIENNTYSARKIVISIHETLSIEEKLEIIEKRLFSFEIDVSKATNAPILNSIELSNFRAFKGRHLIKCCTNSGEEAKLVVLYAPNGTGKTSIFDAVEWSLTGVINRLEMNRSSQNGRTLKNTDAKKDDEAYVMITFSNAYKVRSDVLAIAGRRKKDYAEGKLQSSPEYDTMISGVKEASGEKDDRKLWKKVLLSHERIDSLMTTTKPVDVYEEWKPVWDEDNSKTERLREVYLEWQEAEAKLKTIKDEKVNKQKQVIALEKNRPVISDMLVAVEQYNQITRWNKLPFINFENVGEKEYKDWLKVVQCVKADFRKTRSELRDSLDYCNNSFESDLREIENQRERINDDTSILKSEQVHLLAINDKVRLSRNLKVLEQKYKNAKDEAALTLLLEQHGEQSYAIIQSYFIKSSQWEEYQDRIALEIHNLSKYKKEFDKISFQLANAKNNCSELKILKLRERLLKNVEKMLTCSQKITSKKDEIEKCQMKKGILEKKEDDVHLMEKQLGLLIIEESVVFFENRIPVTQEMVEQVTELKPAWEALIATFKTYKMLQEKISKLDQELAIVHNYDESLKKIVLQGRKLIEDQELTVCPLCNRKYSSHAELLEATYTTRIDINRGIEVELAELRKSREKTSIQLKQQILDYETIRERKVELLQKEESQVLSEKTELLLQIENAENAIRQSQDIIDGIQEEDKKEGIFVVYTQEGVEDWLSSFEEKSRLKLEVLEAQNKELENTLKECTSKVATLQNESEVLKNCCETLKEKIDIAGVDLKDIQDYIKNCSFEDILDKAGKYNKELQALQDNILVLKKQYDEIDADEQCYSQVSDTIRVTEKHIEQSRVTISDLQQRIQKYLQINYSHELNIDEIREQFVDSSNILEQCEKYLQNIEYDQNLELYFRNYRDIVQQCDSLDKDTKTCEDESEQAKARYQKCKAEIEESMTNQISKYPISDIYKKLDPNTKFKTLVFTFEVDKDGKPELKVEVMDENGDKFLPEWYFSTAQLNIVAFAVYIGKALSEKHLPMRTIMIDDPIGHFDDINIVGFADLLRNIIENTDRQIIISTHEDRIFRLLKRKIPESEYPVCYWDCRKLLVE